MFIHPSFIKISSSCVCLLSSVCGYLRPTLMERNLLPFKAPYKVNVCHFDFIEKLEKQIETSFFSPFSLGDVSGKHPCIFYQGNTERQPFLPPPFLIKKSWGYFYSSFSSVTKGSELRSCTRDSSPV